MISGSVHNLTESQDDSQVQEIQRDALPDANVEVVHTRTVNFHDYISTGAEVATTEDMLEAAQKRIAELEAMQQKETLYIQLQMKPDASIRFYTGFPSFKVLAATFDALRPTAEKMYSWSQMQRLRNRGTMVVDTLRDNLRMCKLNLFDQFYLFLTKLRLGTFDQVLADTFNVSVTTVSRTFISWTNFLYFVLGSMPIWPSITKVQRNMPECFREFYPRCRGIIDASEIKVQAPSSMVLNSELYSAYKNHTTYKGNVVISPSGEIIHVSVLFAGSISDKELVKQSGLLPLLEPGDQLLADKGFVIQDILTPIGCEVAMPAFLSNKGQFSKEELLKSKHIHNLRVHVERAIRRVKEFHYFDRVLPLNAAGSINEIWTVACLLTNFQGPLFY